MTLLTIRVIRQDFDDPADTTLGLALLENGVDQLAKGVAAVAPDHRQASGGA